MFIKLEQRLSEYENKVILLEKEIEILQKKELYNNLLCKNEGKIIEEKIIKSVDEC